MVFRTGLFIASLTLAGSALAQEQPDLNDVGNRLIGQTGSVANFLWVLIFVTGVILSIIGLWKFYGNVQNPNDPASRKNVAFVYIVAGALMVALPAVMGTGIMTFFGGDVSGWDAVGGLNGFRDFE